MIRIAVAMLLAGFVAGASAVGLVASGKIERMQLSVNGFALAIEGCLKGR